MPQPETHAIHAGYQIDSATGALTPPIHLSTTFERQSDGSYPLGYEYTRQANPNRQAFEERVATLEGGSAGAAFASGSVATMTVLQALKPGDHVIAPKDFYYGIRLLLQEVFVPWGLAVTFVDMGDLQALEAALENNTRLVMVETPSNPLLQITDLQAVSDLAHRVGAQVVCDNTVSTPILQRPLEHGADLVIHATTKYIGGHSDLLGGMVISKKDSPLWERITFLQKVGGAVPSPFDCWLGLRGIQTLPYRVRAIADHAMQIAQFLEGHPAVEIVHYPGLASHTAHKTAKTQMAAFGGLMSFQLKGGEKAATEVAAQVQLITRATSFGGTHSTIEHRASIEAPGGSTPRNLLRLSVGLEHPADLIADLQHALAAASKSL